MSWRPFDNGSIKDVRSAPGASAITLDQLLYHHSWEALEALLENARLGEQHLLIMLSRKDLSRDIVTKIAQSPEWMSSYAIKLAVLKHPQTPRHLALPLMKFIYLFDLLEVAVAPGVPAELKRLAEDAILSQEESLALGQRISLARRASPRVAAGLLVDRERRVIEAALDNPSLTEESVAAALLTERAAPELTQAVIKHPRWYRSHSVRLALARSRHLSLARILEIFSELSMSEIAELAADRRAENSIGAYAHRIIKARREHF